MKPFVPTTPTFVPSTCIPSRSDGAPSPRVGEHRSNRVALVRVPVVVPKDGDDRIVSGRHASATTAACSGLKVARSPARKEIRTALQRGEGAPNLVAAALVAVNVAHGGDPNQARSRFTSRARRVPGTRE